jgi:hypothetical protein
MDSVENGYLRWNYRIFLRVGRPSAEVIEWLNEIMDTINGDGSYSGDGRSLEKIGEDLGLDPMSLAIVIARTPQKSSLKLFRLLYPTILERAAVGSIQNLPQEQLENIYREFFSKISKIFALLFYFFIFLFFSVYVRTLHRKLSFKMDEMRKAIGTSIRNANIQIRTLEQQQQSQLETLQDNENRDPNEDDNQLQAGIDILQSAIPCKKKMAFNQHIND